VNDVRVSSWNELHDRLYHGSWNASLGRFRSSRAFRGMQGPSFDLQTSLMRLGEGYDKQEGHLLRNFRKYALREAVHGDSVWNWLALGQHHGLPTRLLDWTYSPYVALHFATQDVEQFNVDGVVWSVDYIQTNRLLPDRLKRLLAEEGSDVFTIEMLGRIAPTLPEFDRLAADRFVLFLEPPSLDERIVNQFALFCVMSGPEARLDRWLDEHSDCFQRLIIPAALKWEVRDKLDQANITERVLFPGLDGLSRWLKRYYTPRSK
jgi:FRG domain